MSNNLGKDIAGYSSHRSPRERSLSSIRREAEGRGEIKRVTALPVSTGGS